VLKPLTLTGGFVLAATLALAILAGNIAARPTTTGSTTNSTAEARDRYDSAYQLAYRSDGGRSTVTADAVFEYPELVSALTAYVQRGVLQSQTLDVLSTAGANRSTLAFAVTIAAHGEDVSAFDVPTHAVLVDDRGRTYPSTSWHELSGSVDAARAGILTFTRVVDGKTPEDASAKTLTLTLDGLTGGRRTFTWDLKVLGLRPA
jgi:hypothetical protein